MKKNRGGGKRTKKRMVEVMKIYKSFISERAIRRENSFIFHFFYEKNRK